MPADDPTDADGVSPDDGPLLLDTMLGKLAVYLRLCGYDAAYAGDRAVEADNEVRSLARKEGRTLLSRDVQLVASVEDGVLLTERDVEDQLAELRQAGFELSPADPPVRCGRCNGRLEPVPAGEERPNYAPPPEEYDDVWRCVACAQHFWRGSHWDRMRRALPG